jgi:hypothetical protein
VLGGLREYAGEHPGDPLTVWRDHSTAGFEDHPVDCRHCWALANPAFGDFLAEDGLVACLPPKMRESNFRRARLCQFVDQLEDAWLPPGTWAACTDAVRSIADGADVVLGFDGSFSGDCTALVACTVADRPHVELVELWEPAEERKRPRGPPSRGRSFRASHAARGTRRSACWPQVIHRLVPATAKRGGPERPPPSDPRPPL